MTDKKLSESKHFCILPWMHARVNQGGEVYPCCRIENFYSYGSLKSNTFKDIWNSKAVKDMRVELLNDRAFPICNDCYKIDAQGGASLRQKANRDFSHHLPKVKSTTADGEIKTNDLEFLDIRFSNLCNFKCRSCNHENSSAWYSDARHFEADVPSEIVKPHDNPAVIWDLIQSQLPTLKRIYLAGGEPLLQEEHYKLLELLISQNRTDIHIEYNTNLSQLKLKNWSVIELWSQFKKITVAASLDGVKSQGELIRKGMQWENTVNNFNLIKSGAPNVDFVLAPTISVLNSFHITDAIEEFIRLGMLKNADALRLNILLQPSYLSINILNNKERDALKNYYEIFLKNISNNTPDSLFTKIKAELYRVLGHLELISSSEQERLRFKKFSLKLDQLRNERTFLLFPELVDLFLTDNL
ncbi:MAG: twitch domain-containing radical SAM protein [Pseudobdellovibrio sp.]